MSARSDQFTPVVAAPLTANARPFTGTDGRLHIVYELVLTNTNPTPATLEKVEVLNASDQSKVLASYDDRELLSRLRSTGGTAAENPTIEFNGTRLFLIDLTLDESVTPPGRLLHRLAVLGASSPARKPTTSALLNYTVAPLDIFAEAAGNQSASRGQRLGGAQRMLRTSRDTPLE